MRVLEASIVTMRYDPDYGRVEASVALVVKSRSGQPPHRIQIRTSQPLRGAAPLEDRLITDAITLAHGLNLTQPVQKLPQNLPMAA